MAPLFIAKLHITGIALTQTWAESIQYCGKKCIFEHIRSAFQSLKGALQFCGTSLN